MASQETGGLPGITLWDIARSLGRLENHAEQADARMDRQDHGWTARMDRQDARMDQMKARLDRIVARLDRLFLALFGIGTALIGGLITVLVKLFAG